MRARLSKQLALNPLGLERRIQSNTHIWGSFWRLLPSRLTSGPSATFSSPSERRIAQSFQNPSIGEDAVDHIKVLIVGSGTFFT